MFYSLDEVSAICEGYFFYKASDDIYNKQWKLSHIPEVVDGDTVYIPLNMIVNGDPWDTYGQIEQAIETGARSFLFAENFVAEEKHKEILFDMIQKYKSVLKFVMIVKGTTRQALEKLAIYTRNTKISPNTKIIAITGTMGKTSTTEMVYSILTQSHSCYRGRPTLNVRFINNHKFLEVDKDYDYLLFECSGAVKGYLKYFSELLRPDGAIVTKIAIENIKVYNSLINIARNKASIMYSMTKDAVAVVDDDKFLKEPASWYKPRIIFSSGKDYELVSMEKTGSRFIYKGIEYSLPVVGYHQIENAIKAIELTKALGISDNDIVKGLAAFEQVSFRWEADEYENNVHFVTDCPNPPNYDNIMSNIRIFFDLYKDAPVKRICLSKIEFLEHYEYEIYRKIAKHIIERKFDEVILIGEDCGRLAYHIQNNSDIKVTFFDHIKKLDKDEPLIKYLIDTLDYPQAMLFKTRMMAPGDVPYGFVRNIIRHELYNRLINK